MDVLAVLLALSPVILILLLLTLRRTAADTAGVIGWVFTLLVAWLYFQTPLRIALQASLAGIVASLPIALVVATQSEGTILIHEKMFESRMFFVDKLIGMGARIVLCDPHRSVVSGPSRLRGCELVSPDVRAGMAMVLASLCAEGTSTIHNVYQIERGYEDLCERLRSLGARIERVRE